MAYTIKQDLLDMMPAHNPMPVVVHDSVNYSQEGYKYILDIYINGVFNTRLKAQPEPNYNYGLFDISRIVASNIGITFSGTSNIWQVAPYKTVSVKAGYEYISSGVITQYIYTSGLTYNSCIAFAGGLSYLEHSVLMNNPDYYKNKLLTTSMATETMPIGAKAYVDVYFEDMEIAKIRVTAYNSAGGAVSVNDSSVTGLPSGNSIMRIGYGPKNMVDNTLINPATAKSYDVKIYNPAGDIIKTTKTVIIDQDCDRYTPSAVQLVFLNQFGGFDYIMMNKKNSRFTTVNRTTTQVSPTVVGSTGYQYWSYFSGQRTVNTTYKQRMVLNSGFKSDAEFKWLENLITSPLVYMYDESNSLWIVNITDVEYEHKRVVNNKLSNITLSIEYSLENNRQRY